MHISLVIIPIEQLLLQNLLHFCHHFLLFHFIRMRSCLMKKKIFFQIHFQRMKMTQLWLLFFPLFSQLLSFFQPLSFLNLQKMMMMMMNYCFHLNHLKTFLIHSQAPFSFQLFFIQEQPQLLQQDSIYIYQFEPKIYFQSLQSQ